MTPSEFKAWFDGFTEAFSGCPTKAQWARIKARVAEIDGKPVTERIYVDRYWPTYVPSPAPVYPGWRYLTGISSTTNLCGNATTQTSTNVMSDNMIGSGGAAFNSMQAMADLGRVEARSLS